MLKKINREQKGSAILEITLVVIVLIAVGLVGWSVNHKTKVATAPPTSTTKSTTTTPSASTASSSSSLPTGTDNASLDSDLTNINSGLTQTGTDSTSTNSAINDQGQEITVPTN